MTSLVTDYLNNNNPEGYIDFYQIDTTSKGGSIYYVTPQASESGTITFAGTSYTCIPCAMSKTKMSTTGTLPQPQFSIAATSNPLIRAAINSLGTLAGCKITKFSTFEKYLDAVNTSRVNLLDWSQDLTNAAWVKSATTVTANAVEAPDGTLTADFLKDDLTNAQHFISKSSAAATFNTADRMNCSCYVKYAGVQYILLYISASGTAGIGGGPVVDLLTGNIVASNNTAFISNMVSTDVGNGWYRVSWTCFANSTAVTARAYLTATASGSAPAYTGTGTNGAYLWGYQVERVTQQQVDASLMTASNSIIQLNSVGTTDPLGTNTADVIVDTAVNSTHSAFRSIAGFTQGQRVYFTIHCRAGGTISNVMVRFIASSALAATGYAAVNLTTGVITSNVGLAETPTIQALTNSWYRIRIAVDTTADGTLTPAVFLMNTPSNNTYLGTGAGVYIWNGQVTWDEYLRDYQYTTTTHAPYADPLAISPVESYIISQMLDMNKNTITWKLTTPLDRPNLFIPRLQYLKDDIGETATPSRCVYAPGLNRIME